MTHEEFAKFRKEKEGKKECMVCLLPSKPGIVICGPHSQQFKLWGRELLAQGGKRSDVTFYVWVEWKLLQVDALATYLQLRQDDP